MQLGKGVVQKAVAWKDTGTSSMAVFGSEKDKQTSNREAGANVKVVMLGNRSNGAEKRWLSRHNQHHRAESNRGFHLSHSSIVLSVPMETKAWLEKA